MSEFMSFAQVLEDKIRAKIQFELKPQNFTNQQQGPHQTANNQSVPREFDTDPAHLSYIHSQVSLKKINLSERSQHHLFARSSYPKPLPPKPAKPHSFNHIQQKAYVFFQTHGAQLSLSFNSKDLKAAFRKLAKKLHPDTSGLDGKAFHSLKQAFETLHTLPKK